MYIGAKTLDDLLRAVLSKLLKSRNRIRPTKGSVTELTGVLLKITKPRARLSRTETKGTLFSCLGELFWYLAKTNDLGFISYYLNDYKKYSDDGKTVYGGYPLFVAEGSPEGKLEQIQRTGYLWYCLDKLARIEGPLVVFGHSLGNSDQHIVEVIADNPRLPLMAVGIHGDPKSASNQLIKAAVSKMKARREEVKKRRKSAKGLEVLFYDSDSANQWSEIAA